MGGMDSVATHNPSQEITSNKVLQIRNLPGDLDAAAGQFKAVLCHLSLVYQPRVWNPMCATLGLSRMIAHYCIQYQAPVFLFVKL